MSKNSDFQNLTFHKNSHFQNIIFHKIHHFIVSLFIKFTFSKSHFSQNSHFSNIKFWIKCWFLPQCAILAFYFSCVPNCRIIQHHETPYKSYCMAAKRIMKGEELTITYTNLLMPTFMRRQKLKENWYFDCACQRCGDRSEFGTCVSAIRCGRCENR